MRRLSHLVIVFGIVIAFLANAFVVPNWLLFTTAFLMISAFAYLVSEGEK